MRVGFEPTRFPNSGINWKTIEFPALSYRLRPNFIKFYYEGLVPTRPSHPFRLVMQLEKLYKNIKTRYNYIPWQYLPLTLLADRKQEPISQCDRSKAIA